jgi:hypothetical protein
MLSKKLIKQDEFSGMQVVHLTLNNLYDEKNI